MPSPWDTGDFIAFIDGAFAGFIAAGASDLLLDLRDNPGGDNSFSDPMLAWIADEPFRFSPAFDIRVSAQTVASNRARIDAMPAGGDSVSHHLATLYAGAAEGSRVSFPIPPVPPRAGSHAVRVAAPSTSVSSTPSTSPSASHARSGRLCSSCANSM